MDSRRGQRIVCDHVGENRRLIFRATAHRLPVSRTAALRALVAFCPDARTIYQCRNADCAIEHATFRCRKAPSFDNCFVV